MSDRIRAAADAWRDMREKDDETVARAILEDEIDILVDLSGHTGGARIAVLAGRAAPVQMTWLGYINTTGLTRVDYRITDAIADPPGMSEALHTETLLRMPHSQWCFRPSESSRRVPIARDPSLGAFTFGVMNQYAKVSASTVALWIEVMRAIPGARLRVVNVPRGSAAEALSRKLVEANIDSRRFDLLERIAFDEYFRLYAQTDACLDTTPYSGGTTTCDALYFGVPVITLAGARPISRSTASLLTAVGSPDLVARSPEEFVAIASRLAAPGHWSNAARKELRARMVSSALMDEQGFTQDLEAMYRKVWRDWCADSISSSTFPG
jgi:predicted O-linked N-acetylglucosamine transferase (SPINDLY family)